MSSDRASISLRGVQSAADLLLDSLEDGFQGVLEGESPECGFVSVYVSNARVVAAQSDEDILALLRVAETAGHLHASRVAELRSSATSDQSPVTLLEALLPPALLEVLLRERARENLFAYLRLPVTPQREPLETLQMSGESPFTADLAQIQEMIGLVRLLDPLERQLACGLSSVGGRPTTVEEGRILALVTPSAEVDGLSPRTTLLGLLSRSPWERTRTLTLVRTLLEADLLESDSDLAVPGVLPPRRLHGKPNAAAPRSGRRRHIDAFGTRIAPPRAERPPRAPMKLRRVDKDGHRARTLAPAEDTSGTWTVQDTARAVRDGTPPPPPGSALPGNPSPQPSTSTTPTPAAPVAPAPEARSQTVLYVIVAIVAMGIAFALGTLGG